MRTITTIKMAASVKAVLVSLSMFEHNIRVIKNYPKYQSDPKLSEIVHCTDSKNVNLPYWENSPRKVMVKNKNRFVF